MSTYMGRSFDRGGRSRKEREHGKRRAYQQAERDREARQAVTQAKRTEALTEISGKRRPAAAAPIALMAMETAQPPAPDIPVAVIAERKPGFVAQVFRRLFKKSA
jgi:hypothetical protein